MRALLVLARVSNLPTVWSNCLAAWLLAGGTDWRQFGLLCLGAALLYTGGMFLNDAVDQDFDRKYRPERPIVSGQISARVVWVLALSWLGAGWAVFLWLGRASALFSSLLVVAIVVYDLIHKRTSLAPLLMATCRFLLYVVAGAVASHFLTRLILVPAAALATYVVGLSYLARGESRGPFRPAWSGVLLFAPVAISLFSNGTSGVVWISVLLASWILWCLWPVKAAILMRIPKGVAGLLAGIALVDWLAAGEYRYSVPFLGLFVLALLLQRIAPAT